MRRQILRTTKIREGRGEGTGADYRPWIKAREISSIGTTHNVVDWKHGRTVELLSEGEMMLYYILRWNDKVTDIREQFPLNLEETNQIADAAHLMRVRHGEDNMTTDMLVSFADGSCRAYSVKADRSAVNNPRTVEKLWIEKTYWAMHKVPWKQVYKSELNRIYVDNIRLCVEYYDKAKVHDDFSHLKHLIAVKLIVTDMETAPLDFGGLVSQWKESSIWKA